MRDRLRSNPPPKLVPECLDRNIPSGIRGLFLVLFMAVIVGSGTSVRLTSASPHSCAPHLETIQDGFRYGLPPHIEKDGLVFASIEIPIRRQDIRDRILHEINYLLLDRRSRVLFWLSRADSLGHVITPILTSYKLPTEFIYLAAIESSFNGRALSSAGAFGYWQFIKSTAQQGPVGCNEYDWKMHITNWKDERADLVRSTHSAARYLAWMNRVKKVSLEETGDKDGFNDWLLSAAAYNAGPTKVIQRLGSFGASSYWDVPLPRETEQYVPRWIALGIISKNREYYGVHLPPNRTFSFDTLNKVVLVKDLPLAAMAKLLGTSPRVVWELNSSVPSEKCIFPARSGRQTISHTIYVPKDAGKKFLAQLAAQGYTRKK
ncbi:MAG: lytic transglycosylase domain-containing protein [Desulfomonile sp.]|nr:lytic transglycosylase domain-containing protein [Deltaproteobacteria bacterium]